MSKDAIHLDWLRFDPEALAKAVPVSEARTVSWRDIEQTSHDHAPGLRAASRTHTPQMTKDGARSASALPSQLGRWKQNALVRRIAAPPPSAQTSLDD